MNQHRCLHSFKKVWGDGLAASMTDSAGKIADFLQFLKVFFTANFVNFLINWQFFPRKRRSIFFLQKRLIGVDSG